MGAKKRLVYADALIDHFEWLQSQVSTERAIELKDHIQRIKDAPTVDAVEVVRCKDCKHWHEETGWCDHHSNFIDEKCEACHPWESNDWKMFNENDFCSDGERKDNVKRNEN